MFYWVLFHSETRNWKHLIYTGLGVPVFIADTRAGHGPGKLGVSSWVKWQMGGPAREGQRRGNDAGKNDSQDASRCPCCPIGPDLFLCTPRDMWTCLGDLWGTASPSLANGPCPFSAHSKDPVTLDPKVQSSSRDQTHKHLSQDSCGDSQDANSLLCYQPQHATAPMPSPWRLFQVSVADRPTLPVQRCLHLLLPGPRSPKRDQSLWPPLLQPPSSPDPSSL